jgi:hypothetical protein
VPGDLYSVNISVAVSISEELSSGTDVSAVYILVCLTSHEPFVRLVAAKGILPPVQNNVGICKLITVCIFYHFTPVLMTLLKFIYVSV